MIDLSYNNGDLVVNRYGDLAICSDEDVDIIQTVNNNIMMRYGNNKYHPDIGNKVYTRRIKINEIGMDIVINECTTAILHDIRVKEVININVRNEQIENNNICIISYTLLVIDLDNNQTRIVDGRCSIDAL